MQLTGVVSQHTDESGEEQSGPDHLHRLLDPVDDRVAEVVAPVAPRNSTAASGLPTGSASRWNSFIMFFFSNAQTIPKYWRAWKKFMMKNASPNVLKPQV